jgi:hypothetical protein
VRAATTTHRPLLLQFALDGDGIKWPRIAGRNLFNERCVDDGEFCRRPQAPSTLSFICD